MTQSGPTDMQVYDCIVLSGGGSRGAYGAGAAKAIEACRRLRGSTSTVCYIGASAGALSAYMLASQGPDALVAFWRRMTNRAILGTDARPTVRRIVWRLVTGRLAPTKPFSIYDNRTLAKLINANGRLSDLKSPLIVAATDYTTGSLAAFYHSSLVDDFVAVDAKAGAEARRLGHLRRIEDDTMLGHVLTASAAIPVFFPPVEIATTRDGISEAHWFIDGGVGNNTPTREAAYFYRYLEQLERGRAGMVYCVMQDEPRRFLEGHNPMGLADIVRRTLDVFQAVHMGPVVRAWGRINREVDRQQERVKAVAAWLDGLEISPDSRDSIKAEIQEVFGSLGGHTARVSAPMVLIEPSIGLGDALDFHPARAEDHIRHGYVDALRQLRGTADPARPGQMLIDEPEYDRLVNAAI